MYIFVAEMPLSVLKQFFLAVYNQDILILTILKMDRNWQTKDTLKTTADLLWLIDNFKIQVARSFTRSLSTPKTNNKVLNNLDFFKSWLCYLFYHLLLWFGQSIRFILLRWNNLKGLWCKNGRRWQLRFWQIASTALTHCYLCLWQMEYHFLGLFRKSKSNAAKQYFRGSQLNVKYSA